MRRGIAGRRRAGMGGTRLQPASGQPPPAPRCGDGAVDGGRGAPTTSTRCSRCRESGPYTARAVLVFAFEQDVGVVDTNIARVLSRRAGRRLTTREAQATADAAGAARGVVGVEPAPDGSRRSRLHRASTGVRSCAGSRDGCRWTGDACGSTPKQSSVRGLGPARSWPARSPRCGTRSGHRRRGRAAVMGWPDGSRSRRSGLPPRLVDEGIVEVRQAVMRLDDLVEGGVGQRDASRRRCGPGSDAATNTRAHRREPERVRLRGGRLDELASTRRTSTARPGAPRSAMSCTLHDVHDPQSASASITRSHFVEISWRRSTGAGFVNVGFANRSTVAPAASSRCCEPIEEHVAAGLRDVEQADRAALDRGRPLRAALARPVPARPWDRARPVMPSPPSSTAGCRSRRSPSHR